MVPEFTKHGLERAVERGITSDEIDAILASEKTVLKESDKDKENAFIAIGKLGEKYWFVACNIETGAVITVRRAREKERRLYEEKNGN